MVWKQMLLVCWQMNTNDEIYRKTNRKRKKKIKRIQKVPKNKKIKF